MAKRDYYEVLGLSRNASEADIKKAYRRMAMKYHPDRNPNDKESEDKFKEAKQAYDVLTDPRKRAAYDQFGHAGVDPSGGAAGAGGFRAGPSFSDIFDDVFGDIFGGARGSGGGGRAGRGSDLRYDLSLSLEDAVQGTTVKVRIPTLVQCTTCGGDGAKPGTRPTSCSTCGGVGQVRMQQGFFSIQQTCPACHGEGTVVSTPCDTCHGRGRVQDHKTLSVKIPPGVDNGDRIRLTAEGEAGVHGGPAGDLYVQIRIEPHPIFTRQGSDLLCDVPISFATAALGGELEVPTLEGQVKLKIPPETQTGRVFRMRSKGVRSVHGGGTGDLMCRVTVETPVNLNYRQKELLRELDQSVGQNSHEHSPKAKTWLNGVKKFFEDMKF